MAEVPMKSSTKKGFTVPVLKDSVAKTELSRNDGKKEKQKKPKKKASNNKLDSEEEELESEKQKEKAKKETNNKLDSEEEELESKKQKEKAKKKYVKETEVLKGATPLKSEKKLKKPQVNLSDSQYEDIFSAVLKRLKSNSNSQQNTPGQDSQSSETYKENIPVNEGKGGSQKSLKRSSSEIIQPPATPAKHTKKLETKTPPSKHNKPLPELSPWGTHFNKQPSQSSSILKELHESQNSLMNSSALMSPKTSSSSDSEDEGRQMSQVSMRQLSQISGYGSQNASQPRIQTDQRRKLEELQKLRNVGVWVYCCRLSCQKQRYLSDITDPQDVPDIWYCHMNPDPKYNSCQSEEQQLSAEEEADMIYNQFTAGSLVWARVAGYPWWPAMVDDDPDLEQYYWLEEDLVTVTFYHVVFFDEVSVTRAWVNLKNISSYNRHDNKYKQRTVRGVDFSRRILVAKEQANDALSLSTSQRLSVYSFIGRYAGPISTSAAQAKKTMTKYKLKVKTGKKACSKIDLKKERKSNNISQEKPSRKRVNKELKKTEHCVKRKKEQMDAKKSELLSENPRGKKNEKVKRDKTTKKTSSSGYVNNSDKVSVLTNTLTVSKEDQIENNKLLKSTIEKQKEASEENCKKFSGESQHKELTQEKSTKPEKSVNASTIDPDEEANGIEDGIEKIANNESSDMTNLEVDSTSKEDSSLVSKDDNQSNKNATKSPLLDAESETPSLIESNLSQKSKSSGRTKRELVPMQPNTEDTFGSIIGPSQAEERGDDVESKHSQNTIVDFFAAESEDAVVPEATSFDLSQPFEE